MRQTNRFRGGAKGLGIFALLAILLLGALAVMRRYRHAAVPAGALARYRFLSDLVTHEATGANYMLLADTEAEMNKYDEARTDYRRASAIYRTKNLSAESYVAERFAERYEVSVLPFVHVPSSQGSVTLPATRTKPEPKLAKFEPAIGCYTGAFIDHEDSIRGTYRDEYGEWRRDASAFNHLTNTHHAIFFMYLGYGRHFPTKFVRHMNDNGAAPQIAWEPDHLSDVQDDAYLHAFAKAARASRTPIFLRFASEMNGPWTPYHGDPALYIEKFRLVSRVMHAEAPNVAMVWCPFETPTRPIPDYYPGADAVDWVGINIYSVPFWDNRATHPAEWRNPADSLRYIYGIYAARHPIMICEYAASHRSSLDGQDRTEFARTKMSELYAALPRLYPRVKAVCWLSMNAIRHAIPGRQNNDYSILDDPAVRGRYAELLRDPYFLPKVSRDPIRRPAAARVQTAKQSPAPLVDGVVLSGKVSLSAWVKLYDDHPMVVWRANGTQLFASDLPGPYRVPLDTSTLPEGPATISLQVLDRSGREVADETRRVEIQRKSQ